MWSKRRQLRSTVKRRGGVECRLTVVVHERDRLEGVLPWADHLATFLQDVLRSISATKSSRTQNIPLLDVVGILPMPLLRGQVVVALQDPPDAGNIGDAKNTPPPDLEVSYNFERASLKRVLWATLASSSW